MRLVRLTRLVLPIGAADTYPVTRSKMLWQLMCGFYIVLLGRVPMPSHDLLFVSIFRDIMNYFVIGKLVLVTTFCLIPLKLRKLRCVVSVTVGARFVFSTRCFGFVGNTDGIFSTIFKYWEGAVTYSGGSLDMSLSSNADTTLLALEASVLHGGLLM